MADRIDEIDQQLEDWITERVDVPSVSFDPPGEASTQSGISLFLVELVDAPPPRTTEPTPLQLFLRYLVTVWAETPQKTHRMLGDLVFEAMQTEEFDLELTAPENAFWTSLGVSPRPSFFLSVPFRRERPSPEPRMVRQPIVLETAQLRSITGRVVGPEDVPIPGATVEIPALNSRADTDRKGWFRFDAVPEQSEPERLVVRAKGVQAEERVDLSSDADQPLTIQIDPDV